MDIMGMKILETAEPSRSWKADILALWNAEYPKALALDANGFETYLEGLDDRHHLLITDTEGRVRGWLIYFIRDGDRWFTMALDSSLQGKGIGSRLLSRAMKKNNILNGWVIDQDGEARADGLSYKSPLGFYRKLGFEIREKEVLVKKGIRGIRVRWERANPNDRSTGTTSPTV